MPQSQPDQPDYSDSEEEDEHEEEHEEDDSIADGPPPPVEIFFEGTDEPLNGRDLAHFLYLFRAVYAAAFDYTDHTPEEIFEYREKIIYSIRQSFETPTAPSKVSNLFFTDLDEHELSITRISKESPLTIWAVCVISALVVAVILSGGEVDLKNLKFKLPSLGKGIKELRAALNLSDKTLPKRTPKKRNG